MTIGNEDEAEIDEQEKSGRESGAGYLPQDATTEFRDKTTTPNQLWRTDFSEFDERPVQGLRLPRLDQGESAIAMKTAAKRKPKAHDEPSG
jgi:hypothetical protein